MNTEMSRQEPRSISRHHRRGGRAIILAALVAVVLALMTVTGEATAATDVKTEVTRADNAIDRAARQVRAHQYGKARKSFARADSHVRGANRQAAALIGAPPTDPESDDPPGPPAVLAALRLDHRVTMRVAPLYDGIARPKLVTSMSTTIRLALNRRTAVLDRVLALPAEGDGADYADSLADTLPSYTREVTTLEQALDTLQLTTEARDALTAALKRAREAEARMQSAFGGGEWPVV